MMTINYTSRLITEATRNQFDSTYKMLTTLVDICPDSVWYEYQHGAPFWYHIFHVTFFIDFWFRDTYDDSEFRSMTFDERIMPEFEQKINPEVSVSRTDMREYLEKIHVKTSRIFDSLDDEQMGVPIVAGSDKFTYTDVIMGQIRHIMYNIGYLNKILRDHGAEESDWYAYNEDDDK
ncbi:MAG: DinB family protein [Mobilitalea sp.]